MAALLPPGKVWTPERKARACAVRLAGKPEVGPDAEWRKRFMDCHWVSPVKPREAERMLCWLCAELAPADWAKQAGQTYLRRQMPRIFEAASVVHPDSGHRACMLEAADMCRTLGLSTNDWHYRHTRENIDALLTAAYSSQALPPIRSAEGHLTREEKASRIYTLMVEAFRQGLHGVGPASAVVRKTGGDSDAFLLEAIQIVLDAQEGEST